MDMDRLEDVSPDYVAAGDLHGCVCLLHVFGCSVYLSVSTYVLLHVPLQAEH